MLSRVYSYSFTKSAPREKTFLGERDLPRFCRFCGGTTPEAIFGQQKHILPAAFGNRTLFSHEECDACNADGSELENDLASFLAIERAMARMRSRKGSVKYRKPGTNSFIESSVDSETVTISRVEGETIIEKRDVDDHSFDLVVQTPKFRPLNVGRALARMMLFALGRDEIKEWAHVLDWVRGKQTWLPVVHRAFIPGPGLKTVGFEVLRQDEPDLLMVAFWFSTTILFLRVPKVPWNLPAEVTLPAIPDSPYPPHKPKLTAMILKRDEVVPSGTATVRVSHLGARPA